MPEKEEVPPSGKEVSICGNERVTRLLRDEGTEGLKARLAARWREKARGLARALERRGRLEAELFKAVEEANSSKAALKEADSVLLIILEEEEKGGSHEEAPSNDTGSSPEPSGDGDSG